MKILLVDDNNDDRRMLCSVLKAHGHEVIEAVNGWEGLQAAFDQQLDMVISDVLMPVMDGFRFLRSLRETSSVPFVFYSAVYDGNKDIQLATSLGADGYLTKPRDPLELLEEIGRIAAKGAQERSGDVEEEAEYLKRYSQVVAAKLEEKVRELEAALAERTAIEQRQSRFFANAPGFFYTLLRQPDGTISMPFASDGLTALYGLHPADAVKDFSLLVSMAHPDDVEMTFMQMEESARTMSPYQVEYRINHPDKGERWMEARSTPECTMDGSILWHGFIFDITGRKKAEEEREELREQLLQAQRMDSIGRLAGGVAHDFNNMLAVVSGYTEMALNQITPDNPLFTSLLEVRNAAERSADLTRQLLTFARKQYVAPALFDLNKNVAKMLTMLRRLIGENIKITWQPGTEGAHVKMDPSQMDQILANLCVNARDAITGNGAITIETQVLTLDDASCASHIRHVPGEYVLLAVSDDGCGMDKKTLDKLFEPFFTTKETGKGTGLGLATVYGIVKQNNGFIDVCSAPGRGTTFQIFLPRQMPVVEQTAAEAPATPVAQGNETILLVEDEPALLKMTSLMLKSFGFRVLAALTPDEALGLANKHAGEIHLLLTDVIMPGMNGMDLAKGLNARHPEIKQLFMSGYTGGAIVQQNIPDEDINFIQKPFSLPDLAAKVREALDGA